MKKSIVKLLPVTVVACAIIVGSFSRVKVMNTGDITLVNNVQALARGESSTAFCYGEGTVECNGMYVKVRYDAR